MRILRTIDLQSVVHNHVSPLIGVFTTKPATCPAGGPLLGHLRTSSFRNVFFLLSVRVSGLRRGAGLHETRSDVEAIRDSVSIAPKRFPEVRRCETGPIHPHRQRKRRSLNSATSGGGAVRKSFAAAARRAGIDRHITPHICRHTAAT